MIVTKARQCKFRSEDGEGDGSCTLSQCDCPERVWVKRAEPLFPQHGPRTVREELQAIMDRATLPPGPKPKYSPEDQARLDDHYERAWPEFKAHHECVDAIPAECRLREGGMIFGDEVIHLDVTDPERVELPRRPDVTPTNQDEIDAPWGKSLSGFLEHYNRV